MAGIKALDEVQNALAMCTEAVQRDLFDPNDDGDYLLHAQFSTESAADAAKQFREMYDRCFLGKA